MNKRTQMTNLTFCPEAKKTAKARRMDAPRTPADAGLNTLDWDGVTFIELPAETSHSNIEVLVAVVKHGAILAVAEAELPCRRPMSIRWPAVRTSLASRKKLARWNTGVRMLLRDVHREDRGREG